MKRERRPFFSTPFFAVLGRSAGMVVPFLIALFYGAVPATDAFFLAFGTVFFLSDLFAQMFEALLIPFLTEMRNDTARILSFVRGVLRVSLLPMLALLILLGSVLSPALEKFVKVSPSQADLVARLYWELAPVFILGTLNAAANSIFYSQKKFWFPAFSPFLRSILVIAFFPLTYRTFGIHALTAGFVIGEALRTMATFRLLQKSGFRIWTGFWNFREGGEGVGKFLKHAPFQLLALVAIHLAPLVNQWFAMGLGEGKLSLLVYAERLLQVPYQIFLIGFLQIFFSYWSDSYYHESSVFFWTKIYRDIRTVIGVAAGVSLLLWSLRLLLIRLCYGHGEISASQLPLLAEVFGWLAAGFIPGVILLLYLRVLFVMKRSFFYFVFSWCKLMLHVVLNFVLIRRFGFAGIAMSSTAVYAVSALWLHGYLKMHSKREIDVAEA